VVRRLESLGAEFLRQTGSHRHYRFGQCQTSVPQHPGDIPPGTLRAIERAMEPCFGKGWLR
jgi:predicted RNA binding protein YcfA (HicA-like mRNA interferase family)